MDDSPQHSRFLQQLLQTGLALCRTIQCSLECLPQGLVQCEMATVCQGLGGCRDAGVEQELADVLVAGTGSFLQQLLDGCAGTNVDAFGLGTVAGTHRSSRKGGFGILRLWLSGQCPDNAPRSGRTQGGCPRKKPDRDKRSGLGCWWRNTEPNPRPQSEPDSNALVLRAWIR